MQFWRKSTVTSFQQNQKKIITMIIIYNDLYTDKWLYSVTKIIIYLMKEKQHFYVLNYAEKKRFAQIIIFFFWHLTKKENKTYLLDHVWRDQLKVLLCCIWWLDEHDGNFLYMYIAPFNGKEIKILTMISWLWPDRNKTVRWIIYVKLGFHSSF